MIRFPAYSTHTHIEVGETWVWLRGCGGRIKSWAGFGTSMGQRQRGIELSASGCGEGAERWAVSIPALSERSPFCAAATVLVH